MTNQVAQTILAQLGGSRFVAMTGARDMVSGERELQMHINARTSRGRVRCVRVRLDSNDTYSLAAYDYRNSGLNVTQRFSTDGLHADQLRTAFETATELRTSL